MVVILNLFLGWTMIGWVVALAIAFQAKTAQVAGAPGPIFAGGSRLVDPTVRANPDAPFVTVKGPSGLTCAQVVAQWDAWAMWVTGGDPLAARAAAGGAISALQYGAHQEAAASQGHDTLRRYVQDRDRVEQTESRRMAAKGCGRAFSAVELPV